MSSWLDNKTWAEITREERHFCANLYLEFRDRPKKLVEFIAQRSVHTKESSRGTLDPNLDWELAFEMAFYRDQKNVEFATVGDKKSFQSTKFDLALISETQFVIVEAKAQGGFESSDLDKFKDDLTTIRCSQPCLTVQLVALCSSRWFKSGRRKIKIEDVADYVVTWNSFANQQLIPFSSKSTESFVRADAIYGR